MDQDRDPHSVSYRLYVTGKHGQIDKVAQEVRATSDAEALAIAKDRVGEIPFEIWDGGRRVETAGHGERSPT